MSDSQEQVHAENIKRAVTFTVEKLLERDPLLVYAIAREVVRHERRYDTWMAIFVAIVAVVCSLLLRP